MSKKTKAPKAPKAQRSVEPMDRKKKNVLVWTITGVAVAGIATGITVPLVLASQKETYVKAFGKDFATSNLFADSGLTPEQLQELLNKAGLADASLLNEITYQSSFFLYEKEQKGSLKSQMRAFEWEIETMAKGTGLGFRFQDDNSLTFDTMLTDDELKNTPDEDLSEIAKIRKQLVTDYSQDGPLYSNGGSTFNDFVTTDNGINKFKSISTKEGRAPKRDDAKYQKTPGMSEEDAKALTNLFEKDLQRYNDLNAQLKTKKELANKVIDKVVKLKDAIIKAFDTNKDNDLEGGIDYNSKDFASDFPQVLLPIKNIREKQTKIYNDMRDSVINSKPTREEGLLEWSKQMPGKFDGATEESQAIDSLVHRQVSSTAFTRFEFAINSDFTVKQYKSNIFSEILGEYKGKPEDEITSTDVSDAKANGVGLKLGALDSDKVYFFGTKSKEAEAINALKPGSSTLGYINRINEKLDLISINNAIFPVKQGTTADAPWTITKDDITKLFQTYGTEKNLPISQWGQIFTHGGEAELLARVNNTPGAKTLWDEYHTKEEAFTTAKNAALANTIAKAYIEAKTNFDAIVQAEKTASGSTSATETAYNEWKTAYGELHGSKPGASDGLLIWNAYEEALNKVRENSVASKLWDTYNNALSKVNADATAKALWAAFIADTNNQTNKDAVLANALTKPLFNAWYEITKTDGNALAKTLLEKEAAVKGDSFANGYYVSLIAVDQKPAAGALKNAELKLNETENAEAKTLVEAFNTARTEFKAAYDAVYPTGTASDDQVLVQSLIESKGLSISAEDKELIGRASGTTDSTRWNGGDLGLMSSLNYIKGMTNGWAAGVTAVMSNDQDAIYSPAGGENVLQGLTDTIAVVFYDLAVAKGRLGLTAATSSITSTSTFAERRSAAQERLTAIEGVVATNEHWNEEVKDFVTSLSDDEVNNKFGAAIRDYFKNLPSETGTGTVSGLPVAIEIEHLDISPTSTDTSGIYMTFTEEFGIHVMKFNTGTNNLVEKIEEDLAKAAEDQATTRITTDYAKLLTEKLTQARKIELIMFMDSGTPANNGADGQPNTADDVAAVAPTVNQEFKDYLKDKVEVDLDGDKDNNEDEWADANYDQKVWDKTVELINSIIASEDITTTNAIPSGTLVSWLTGRIDNRLSGNPIVNPDESMDPDEIYNDLQSIGGI